MANTFEAYLNGFGMAMILVSTFAIIETNDPVWAVLTLGGLAVATSGYALEKLYE